MATSVAFPTPLINSTSIVVALLLCLLPSSAPLIGIFGELPATLVTI